MAENVALESERSGTLSVWLQASNKDAQSSVCSSVRWDSMISLLVQEANDCMLHHCFMSC